MLYLIINQYADLLPIAIVNPWIGMPAGIHNVV